MGALFSVPTVTQAMASLHSCDSRWTQVQVSGMGRGSREFGDASRSLPVWGPRGDLLHNPQVAVGIVEGAEGSVAGVRGVGTRLARRNRERRTVPYIEHVDATLDERVM